MGTGSTRRAAWTTRLAGVVALSAGLLAVVALQAPVSPAFGVDDGGFAQRMLELVNQQRASAQVAPLQWSASLGGIAQDARYDGCGFAVSGRATDMGVRNYFSHTILGCGSQSLPNILTALGIQNTANGENLAWMSGTTDPLVAAERLTNDLMASPTHRANILSPDFTHIGIGSWHTATGASWSGGGTALRNVFLTAQVFARMSPTASTTTTVPPTTTTTRPPTTTTTVPPTTTTTRAPTTTTTTTTTPPAALPGMPTTVVATGGDASIGVSWAPAASGPAVDLYAVFAWDSSGYSERYVTACAACRRATVTGLTNGRRYYLAVYGHNAAGFGPAAFSGWVTVAAVPAAPTGVTVMPGNASMSATWQAPTNPGTAIDGYGVFAFDAAGYTSLYGTACGTCTSGSVPGLASGHGYVIVVMAHNAFGWGVPTASGLVVPSAG